LRARVEVVSYRERPDLSILTLPTREYGSEVFPEVAEGVACLFDGYEEAG
jgi:hypothetical protein